MLTDTASFAGEVIAEVAEQLRIADLGSDHVAARSRRGRLAHIVSNHRSRHELTRNLTQDPWWLPLGRLVFVGRDSPALVVAVETKDDTPCGVRKQLLDPGVVRVGRNTGRASYAS
jgi:hypothetical protein